ncbi:hypothetical protein LTR64_006560 [Lithohypha guttulata]|uniref:Uncharacterized protein n=1 Tax=Lithohypha guttulata TaxID=1690604 RepID=A0AAN7T7Y6_9EURO|nr:hypothetical protein LTR51_004882 [Lithohypha guttulata]KAK5091489.1 hypothetical protein LTR05_001673 [Lithohypha guttulata]
MAQKCVHKGCGKVFTDPDEECVYHPGPPEFHEGQKGWKCCKPRFLTFDEFLAIPPCTAGKHSTVDDTPAEPAKQKQETQLAADQPRLKPISSTNTVTPVVPNQDATTESLSSIAPPQKPSTPDPRLEEDSDDPDTPVPPNTTCKRRSCGKNSADTRRDTECTYHPGIPIFHEGSKGWTCCKRRVLEFDEFMKIEGCKTRTGHCFLGKRGKKTDGSASEEELQDVRNDFYQTGNTLIVSFYLKKIDKERAKVEFLGDGSGVELDLPTSDGKRFRRKVETWKELVPEKCEKKILGTKLEMVLFKKEGGVGWPVLTKGERTTGERIQIGGPLRA